MAGHAGPGRAASTVGQARARARAPEGWAGGPPRPGAPGLWRALVLLFRAVARLLGLRLRVEGAEHLPAGPCIIAAAPHRTWADPFILVFAVPLEPRVYFFGDGEAVYRDALRAFFFRRIGGVIPIWRGTRGIESHVEAARAVLASGARLAIFPERGPAVTVERARPLAAGLGYLALRTQAPVVPLVLGGTHELYLGRRAAARFLPPVAPPAQPPEGSESERHAAHRFVRDLGDAMAPHVEALRLATEPPPSFRKRWRWLTTAFR
jgi:1-acyl-sn-glycerol-3-phosphate acyltransferase